MRTSLRVAATLAVMALVCALSGFDAHAQLSDVQKKCFKEIGKSGRNFVKSRLKELKKCRDADLKGTGCDTAKRDAALAKAETKLTDGLAKKCTFSAANFLNMGFPGQCADANPGNGFTTADLQACITQSHTDIADELFAVEYDATVVGVLAKEDLTCQREVSKNAQKVLDCVLKNVQKCRAGVMDGKLSGVTAETCRIDDDKTEAAIDKCETKAKDAIGKKCTAAQVTALKICTPDQNNVNDAAECIVDTHLERADSLVITAPPDLIDYEYADPGKCGDGILNSLDEECDGASDAACPGQCGTAENPDGYFACLCKTPPPGAPWQKRERIIEHANADLDNGWTGKSHDSGVVEGGGYILDLYECDGGGQCIVGPNCSLPPHSPCGTTGGPPLENADAICAGLGQGTCRKERTAIGPHCFKDIKKECNPKLAKDPTCNQPDDFCVRSFHGPPLPIAAGGVPVCIVIVFSEDAVGTTNTMLGSSAINYREDSITHSGFGLNKPCPVCGGFCAVNRDRCAADVDCGANGPCVTAQLCSDGPNQDLPCRVTPPFGGPAEFFGSTSVDCPPFPSQDISAGGLDLVIHPITTGTVTRLPAFPCDSAAFTGNACIGGANEGAPCSVDSECPTGTCLPQCFCPAGGGRPEQPNECDPACVGGTNDAGGCLDDSECPGGFCHGGDCRPNPGDTDSAGEGACTAGPFEGTCSISKFKTCNVDGECQGLNCTFCQPGETCAFAPQQCFVNSGLVRSGAPGVTERFTATTFCLQGTASTSINNVSGLPGPGAITRPIGSILVP